MAVAPGAGGAGATPRSSVVATTSILETIFPSTTESWVMPFELPSKLGFTITG